MSTYTIKLNGHTATHDDYSAAADAWDRIVSAVEDGRSIEAELWRHSRYEWDELFYHGIQDPITGQVDTSMFTVLPGVCIISRHCIAALIYP